MRTIEDFLAYFRRQRAWTRSLVVAVPEEHFSWRPGPQAFSCGELVRHLMQSESFWRRLILEAVAGRTYDPFGIQGTAAERLTAFRAGNLQASAGSRQGATFAECLDRWREIQGRTEEEMGRIPAEAFSLMVEHPLLDLRLPLWEMLLTMVGHEVHHRGQLSAYLKVLGVPQPAVLG